MAIILSVQANAGLRKIGDPIESAEFWISPVNHPLRKTLRKNVTTLHVI
jgi:hypothetical protein